MNTAASRSTAHTDDYHCSIKTRLSAEEAFDKISRVSEWWATQFEGSARELGDTFTVRFRGNAGAQSGGETFVDFWISEAVPNSRIVWQVTNCCLPWLQDTTEWTGTRVAWSLTTSDRATTVHMTHCGLTPTVECYSACEKGWDGFVHNSLLQFLEGGKGSPR